MRRFSLALAILIALAAWGLTRWMAWPAALLAALALAACMHLAIVAAGFAWAAALCRRLDEPAPPGWLAAIPAEAWLSMRNMYLDIPWRHRWPMRVPPSPRGAVLLVHGYGCNRGVWRDLDEWLAARGWIVDGVDLEPRHAGLDTYAAQVAAAARDLAARTGMPGVTVIGHSMGGLVARAALSLAPAPPIAHVITIGSPHGGAWHARFGRGLCAAQMLPGSAWLRALAIKEPAWVAARCTCIASRHDNIVTPLSSALLPRSAAALVRDRVAHMALLHDAHARRFIEARLAPPEPRRASAG